MLLGDAGVHEPIGELFGERVQAGTALHGGRDGHDTLVASRFGGQRLAEHARVRRRRCRFLLHIPRRDIERRDTVELLRVLDRRRVSRALARDHVHEHGNVVVHHGRQRLFEQADIMTVYGRRAQDAQLFENHRARDDELLHRLLHVASEVRKRAAESPAALERLLHGVAGLAILRRGSHVTEVLHERAHVARDGHLVIVEDDHHGRLRLADVVERFERHTARQGRVADDGHDLLVAAREFARLRQTERHRQRVGRMTRRMHVVGALVGLRKPGQAAVGAQRAEIIEAAGDQLMRISLVPNVEHDLVVRAIEHAVQGQDDLHRAQR